MQSTKRSRRKNRAEGLEALRILFGSPDSVTPQVSISSIPPRHGNQQILLFVQATLIRAMSPLIKRALNNIELI